MLFKRIAHNQKSSLQNLTKHSNTAGVIYPNDSSHDKIVAKTQGLSNFLRYRFQQILGSTDLKSTPPNATVITSLACAEGTEALTPDINQHCLGRHSHTTGSLTGSRRGPKSEGMRVQQSSVQFLETHRLPEAIAILPDKNIPNSHFQNFISSLEQQNSGCLSLVPTTPQQPHCAFLMLFTNIPVASGNASSAQDDKIKNKTSLTLERFYFNYIPVSFCATHSDPQPKMHVISQT